MPICLLGLGSNLDNPKRQLTFALYSLKSLPKTHLLHVAPYYRNPAWGKRIVPDYYNTVVVLNTQLPPFLLLKHCQRIEVLQKRVRRTPNQARTLDIDILTYGNYRLMHPLLTLPHPGMMERDSVQVPLMWINNTGLGWALAHSRQAKGKIPAAILRSMASVLRVSQRRPPA